MQKNNKFQIQDKSVQIQDIKICKMFVSGMRLI